MSPRVRGIETEYGLNLRIDGGHGWRRVGSDEAARQLFAPVVEANAATNVFLRNGGRLYLDVGSHPEYATPECRTIRDLIAHDRAGDAIVNRLADTALHQLDEQGVPARITILKNNLDSHGNAYGSHENYQIGRSLDYDQVARALTPFLATRQLICGAGRWVRGPRDSWFELSQRAEHTWDPVASSTTRSRPFINTRDEPHADPTRHRRLHVVVGDSTLSQATLLVRIGSTELVLRAIEDGVGFDALDLDDPTGAIRSASRDLLGRTPLELRDGSRLPPVDLQRQIWRRVEEYADTDELRDAHTTWGRVLDAIADDRLDLIEGEIDWVAKYRMLRAWTARHGHDDARLAQLDLAWHDIRPGQGLFRLAEEHGTMRRVVDDEEIRRAVETPPADTRAALRGRFIAAAQASRRTYTVDWMTFTVHDLADGMLSCPDPLTSSDPRVDALIDRMALEPRMARPFTAAQ